MSEGIEIQIGKILDEYEKLTKETVEKAALQTAKSAVQKLKANSPKKSGEYASGWSSRKQGTGRVVYNRTKPGLTHLLEKGHATFNKKGGPYKRTPAHVHIAPVADEASREFEENVRRELQ